MWWIVPPVLDWVGNVALGALAAAWVLAHQPPPDDVPPKPRPARPADDTPQPPIHDGPQGQRLVIPADGDNQCYVTASANGASFKFLIDTGAWIVSFPRSALKGLGIDGSKLVYNQLTSTANGIGKSANIQLHELRIGSWVLHDVPAQVDYNLDAPLLGASLLKLAHLQFTKNACILTLPTRAASNIPDTGEAAQCSESTLSVMRGDKALHLCESTCSAVPWCKRLTTRD